MGLAACVAGAAVVPAAGAAPGSVARAAGPKSAPTLSLQGTVNHTLGGVYAGVGAKEAYSSPAVADGKTVRVRTP